jgi:hypothetical protein
MAQHRSHNGSAERSYARAASSTSKNGIGAMTLLDAAVVLNEKAVPRLVALP